MVIIIVAPLCLRIREIFRVLDLMKMDMINLTIDNLRLVLHRQGVEYERATFQSVLDKTPSECSSVQPSLCRSKMHFFFSYKKSILLLLQMLWTTQPHGSRQH